MWAADDETRGEDQVGDGGFDPLLAVHGCEDEYGEEDDVAQEYEGEVGAHRDSCFGEGMMFTLRKKMSVSRTHSPAAIRSCADVSLAPRISGVATKCSAATVPIVRMSDQLRIQIWTAFKCSKVGRPVMRRKAQLPAGSAGEARAVRSPATVQNATTELRVADHRGKR